MHDLFHDEGLVVMPLDNILGCLGSKVIFSELIPFQM